MNTEQLKQTARDLGADLVGVAPVERFDLFAPEASPLTIQPQTRSVIVLAFSIPRGSLQGMESGTAGYTLGAGLPTSMAIETTYHSAGAWRTRAGSDTAVPAVGEMRAGGVSPDKPEPNVIVEFDFAAHAAGLGDRAGQAPAHARVRSAPDAHHYPHRRRVRARRALRGPRL